MKRHSNRAPTPRGMRLDMRAFTLVEMLVSMSVVALLVLMLSQVLSSVSNEWSRGEGHAERRRGARAIADFIGAELRGAMLPVEQFNAKAQGNLQFLINPPAARLSEEYRNADAIFWQAPLAVESSYGDIACVGYFVKWEQGIPMLCRLFINPTVRRNGAVTANPHFKLYDEDPDAWLSGGIISEVVTPADKAKGYKGLFAEFVVGFWIRSYGLDGRELPSSFDSRTGYDHTYRTPSGVYTSKKYLPASVRVSFAQVDHRHAYQLSLCSDEIKAIVKSGGVKDAHTFMERLTQEAATSPMLAALLPAVTIYQTEIHLHNSR